MRRTLRLVLLLTCVTTLLAAQDQPSDVHQTTTTPPNGRFEIVQSELAAKWTFRLDRFTGQVSQLVSTKEGDYAWEEMEVVGRITSSGPTHPRFQLFSSGIAARYTFLIDTDTGKTWQLKTVTEKLPDGTEEENNVWEPLPK
jgi:hypothetical protein